MADEHQRYERLAVGHVVGGLDDVDAARFRTHLVQCRDCRSRVAELRGIADDLTATEREERAARASTGTTELAAREETEAPPRASDIAPARSWPWRVVAIGLVPLLVLGALAWAVWMRAEVDLTAAALRSSLTALSIVAEGEALPFEVDQTTTTAVRGVVAATADEVVVNLAGLPPIGPNEFVRAVLVDGSEEVLVEGTQYSPTQLGDGRMVDVLDRSDPRVVAVVVRVERLAGLDGSGAAVVQQLVRAALDPAPSATELVGVGTP